MGFIFLFLRGSGRGGEGEIRKGSLKARNDDKLTKLRSGDKAKIGIAYVKSNKIHMQGLEGRHS